MFEMLSGVPKPVAVIIALAVVLVLIALIAWLVRRVGGSRLGGGSMRGRQPRLAVIDAANVDARRKLVLIRRDNIEHLLMIGGPSDVVIEPNIVRAGNARESVRENGRPVTALETNWPLQPLNEPPPRVREETWAAPEPTARPRSADTLPGHSPEASPRAAAPEVTPAPRREPRAAVPPAVLHPAPQADAAGDHNLAEIAQQLEAALRAAPAAPSAEAKTAEAARPQREMKMRIDPRIERGEPKLEIKPEPKLATPIVPPKPELKIEPKSDIRVAQVEPKIEAKANGRPEPKLDAKAEPAPTSRQDFYNNLEEEMASLLGRPPGKQ
jgi:flagellar biogenesis protein FliO